jgi:serine phosphatase RsbU (regulator of sigma subunit)
MSLILFLCSGLLLHSQDKDYEKQLSDILKMNSNTLKIDSLENFSRFVVFEDFNVGEKAAYHLIDLTRHNPKKQRAHLTAYNVLGLALYYTGKNDVALQVYDTLIKKAIRAKDTLMEAKGHGNFGLIYERLGNFKQAFSEYAFSLKCAEKLGLAGMKASAYGNLGNVSIRLEKYKESIPYFENAVKLFSEINNQKAVANQYNSMSQAYDGMNDRANQVTYLRKAEEIYRNIGEKRALGTVLINLAEIELSYFKNPKKATAVLEEALKLKRAANDENGVAIACINLTVQYANEGKFDKANEVLNEAQKITESQGDLFNLSNVIQKRAMLYRMTGDYKNAYDMYKEYVKLKDSILGEKTQKAFAEYKEMYEAEKKQAEIDKLQKAEQISRLEITKNEEQLKREKAQRFMIFGILLCVILVCIILIRAFIQKRNNANILQSKNELINAKNEALQHANTEIVNQKEIIEEKQKEILDSINYARKIQYALLAHESFLSKHLLEHFVLFKPKDIVSGDFYWATEHENKFYLAVCDSTGHGVPGAFMSLLNIGFLSEAIKEKNILQPNEVLNYVRARLIQNIGNDGQQDGMDSILLCYDKAESKISYAAANNEPVLIRNKELTLLPKDKMPVGKGERMESFTLHTVDVLKDDVLYLYTDGYADQFGGPKGKKFKYKTLNDLLLQNSSESLAAQGKLLGNALDTWKGSLEQVDDILVVGIKF